MIPTRERTLSSLARGMFKDDQQKMLEAQTPEEKQMNDYIDTLQHWHFEPANPNKRAGEYQSCQVGPHRTAPHRTAQHRTAQHSAARSLGCCRARAMPVPCPCHVRTMRVLLTRWTGCCPTTRSTPTSSTCPPTVW